MVEEFARFLKERYSINATVQITEPGALIQFSIPRLNVHDDRTLNYLFTFNSKDPYYFRMALPVVDRIETTSPEGQERRRHILETVSTLNSRFKVAKGFLDNNNNVWLVCDSFVYSKDSLDSLFERAIVVLQQYFTDYYGAETNPSSTE